MVPCGRMLCTQTLPRGTIVSRKKLNAETIDTKHPAIAALLEKRAGLADPRDLLFAFGYSGRQAVKIYAERKKNGMQKKGTAINGALLMSESQFNAWHTEFTAAA